MTESTRDKLLAIALEQFAERGFDGVSIANIADALGLSKQALLHHFSTKEKLYGELLGKISREFETRIDARSSADSDVDALINLFQTFAADAREHRPQTALLMRELLDNSQRARDAGHWYLKGFLDSLVARVGDLPAWRDSTRHQRLACVYQILGAINYFAISRDTLEGMFGSEDYTRMETAYDEQLVAFIKPALQRSASRS